MASAFVIFNHLNYASNSIVFQSQSGELRVTKNHDVLQLDFPALPYTPIGQSPTLLSALNVQPREIYESTFDLLCILDNEQEVQRANPNLYAISQLNNRGIILSVLGDKTDVYSRCFYPGCDVPEDPVTGSAHCVIAPYWTERLGKKKIHARQGLRRQGELWCEVTHDRVLLSGSCQLYLAGNLYLP